MFELSTMTMAEAATLQTLAATVQTTCSVGLLTWYLWSAHLERARSRMEKSDDFNSLVLLCRDLGHEARDKTNDRLASVMALCADGEATMFDAKGQFDLWKADMTVVYICLNEVPHYEVRSPSFSTALTRLWIEVDASAPVRAAITSADDLVAFLKDKHDRICTEVDAMSGLLTYREQPDGLPGRLTKHISLHRPSTSDRVLQRIRSPDGRP